MSEPLISVIVPVYNTEKYLKRCIESIISQTYKNLEIILVNDGSSDSSGNLCKEYAKTDTRIKVIDKNNGGPSSARNTGLDASTGDFITFIDSDDFVSHKIIEILFKNLSESDSDCSACGFTETNDSGRINSKHCVKNNIILSGEDSLEYYYSKTDYNLNLVCIWSKLYKRSIWENIRFDDGILFEDYMIMPYWCLNCKKISFIPFDGYFYRRNSPSITLKKGPVHLKKLYTDSFTIFNNHIDLYKDLKLNCLKNHVQNALADKVITQSMHNSIPHGLESFSKKEFNRYYKDIMNSDMPAKRKIKITAFRILGIHITGFIYKLKGSCV